MQPLPLGSEEVEHLRRTRSGVAHEVRQVRIEFRDLTRLERHILIAQQQAHPAGQDVHPLVALMNLHDMFFTAEQVAAELDPQAWEVLVTEARPRRAKDPDGREITRSDTVLVARKVSR